MQIADSVQQVTETFGSIIFWLNRWHQNGCRLDSGMDELPLSPELRDVVDLMLPDGDSLRNFVNSWGFIQGGPPAPTCWNLLEQLLADRSAKTKAGQLLLDIRQLAYRSHDGDKEAGSVLFLISLEATLRLNMLDYRPDEALLRIVRSCKLYPVIESAFPTMRRERKDFQKIRTEQSRPSKARFSPDSVSTLMAAATLAFMHLVRIGLRQPADRDWTEQVRKLPPISRGTARKWWELAKPAIIEQYPDLGEFVLGHLSADTPKNNGEAIRRIRYPFINSLWQLLADPDEPDTRAKPNDGAQTHEDNVPTGKSNPRHRSN